MKTASKSIPWVDMQKFLQGNETQKRETAQEFGRALQQIGFVGVSNIGLQTKTIDKAFGKAKEYFKLPEDIKIKNYIPGSHQGFVPFGTEHAKYTEISDLKEFYQCTGPTQPSQTWPDNLEFKQAMNALYDELEACMKSCLQATAIYLGYDDQPTILSDMLGRGNGVMRVIHYPPIDPGKLAPGALRSAPHEDLGIMTVIPRATRPGLQVKNLNGEWLDVTVPEGAAIINSGDTLAHITNYLIPSTTHQVINPPGEDCSDRYSIPFFGGLKADVMMTVLDKCRGNTPENELPKAIPFGEFMRERYNKIGLK